MTHQPTTSEATLGAFLVVAALGFVVVFGLGVLDPSTLRAHHTYTTSLDDGTSVVSRMDVTIAGRRVGYVEEVALTEDRRIDVIFLVESDFARHVQSDSEVSVVRSLAGASLSIAKGDGGQADDGSRLPGGANIDPLVLLSRFEIDVLLVKIEEAAQDALSVIRELGLGDGKLAGSIVRMLDNLSEGRGTVGRLMTDEDAAKKIFGMVNELGPLLKHVDEAAIALTGTGGALTAVAEPMGKAAGELSTAAHALDDSLERFDVIVKRLDSSMKELDGTLRAIQNAPFIRSGARRVEKQDAKDSEP